MLCYFVFTLILLFNRMYDIVAFNRRYTFMQSEI
jgi:hypothetical protein